MNRPARRIRVLLTLLTLSCALSSGHAQDAAFANDWMTLLYARVKGESVTPPVAARIFAYTGITMNETLAVLGDTASLAEGIRGGLNVPQAGDATYDTLTVLSAALHTVTTGLLRENSDMWQPFAVSVLETKRALSALHAEQVAVREQSVSAEVVSASLELGMNIGRAVLAWAETDGFAEARDAMYATAAALVAARAEDASLWVSRGAGRTPIQPFWGQIAPLSLAAPDACHVPLGIPFDLTPGSAFHTQLLEVYETSQTLSEAERDTAYFWDDEPVETGTIGGHFLMLGTMMVERQALSLRDAATFYAVLGTALHDAFVSAWWSKYKVMLVRPETLLRETLDPDWRPLLQTPNFPEYPSGHAVVGAAAAEVLTHFFGEISFSDAYGVKNPRGAFAAHDQEAMTRSFESFHHAAQENALSRLYGGVHYRVSAENGMAQGECVAQRVLNAPAYFETGNGR